MSENTGGLVAKQKKYFVLIESAAQSYEVPIWAISLEDAAKQAEVYEEAGYTIARIRPEVTYAVSQLDAGN